MPRRKNDRDGDGWSDSSERARGSSPYSASSRPTNDSRSHRRRKAARDKKRKEARRKRRRKSSTMGSSLSSPSSVDGTMVGSAMPTRSIAIIIVPIVIFLVIAIAMIIFFLNFSNSFDSLP